jgi:hypothetical protein
MSIAQRLQESRENRARWRPRLNARLIASLLVGGAISVVALAEDLSKYRNFQLGADLPAIAKQIGASASDAKTLHSRPALIQELEWRPRDLGPSPQAESVSELVFDFYNGELYRIVVNYDRYQIEGLTAKDMADAISVMYGPAAVPGPSVKPTQDRYGNDDDLVARWQDPQYGWDLIRSSYGPSFTLTGLVKRLDSSAQAAMLEAKRLDNQEAPQREAARMASEQEAARLKQEKARIENKPRFRP